jgi:nucleoside-diphosphate-sugar epimerase
MPTLFCFGLGYSAGHYIAEYGARFDRIAGTVRSSEKAAALTPQGLGGRRVTALAFDGSTAAAGIAPLLKESDALLVSVPPGPAGDPVLAAFADAIADARIGSIVYLSTVGVYGDHGGAWVDEETAPKPVSERSRERVAAEREWQALAQRSRKPVATLRLAGIYGPGQNALVQLARGTARRLDKPGQVFNRIHVGDIAQAIEAAFRHRADGLFNVTDDEPSSATEPIAFAAELAGVAPPPLIPFAEAAKSMTPMALSFYGECKRVRNDKLKRELGVALRYPTYREGLRALHASEGAAG